MSSLSNRAVTENGGRRRRTRQREALFRVLESADRPLAAEEVWARARQHVSGLGIATVYRNLRVLLDDGRLLPVQLPGQPDRYELAGKAHHHHFHCQNCDRMFEVETCASDVAEMTPPGFETSHHMILLYGRCRECRGRQG